jgi:hypothetical protein
MNDIADSVDQVDDGSIHQSIARFGRAVAVRTALPESNGAVIPDAQIAIPHHLRAAKDWFAAENGPDSLCAGIQFSVARDDVKPSNGQARLATLKKRAESATFRIVAIRAEIWTIQILILTLVEGLKSTSTAPTSPELQCLADALRFHVSDERLLLQAAEDSGSIGMVALQPNGVSGSACFAQVLQALYQTYGLREDGWHEDADIVSAFREKGTSSHSLLKHLAEETDRIRSGVMVLEQKAENGVGQEADSFEGQLEAIEGILLAPEHVPDAAQSLSGAFWQLRDGKGRTTYQAIESWLEGRSGLIEVWTPIPDLEDPNLE